MAVHYLAHNLAYLTVEVWNSFSISFSFFLLTTILSHRSLSLHTCEFFDFANHFFNNFNYFRNRNGSSMSCFEPIFSFFFVLGCYLFEYFEIYCKSLDNYDFTRNEFSIIHKSTNNKYSILFSFNILIFSLLMLSLEYCV